MSVSSIVAGMQSMTAQQIAADRQRELEEGNGRSTGTVMGKHDFLMLLSAQLRHQDPLNPQNDSDFAAGLAQFSALEQMMNMNNTLDSMNGFQAYSLVGKYVLAEVEIDGRMEFIAGIVESIFTVDGVTYAQINGFDVPITAIREVFDSSGFITAERLQQASAALIGRLIVADLGNDKTAEGIVTRVFADNGILVAQVRNDEGQYVFVPINTIIDVRDPDTDRYVPKAEDDGKPVDEVEDPIDEYHCEDGAKYVPKIGDDEKCDDDKPVDEVEDPIDEYEEAA